MSRASATFDLEMAGFCVVHTGKGGVCYINWWKCLPPYSGRDVDAACAIQRCWRRHKRLQENAAFKATLNLFCDAMVFPSNMRDEIQRQYFSL